MGTLGHYLREAREALGIDLRDAAQQTRISFNYLKALEEEDFSKLPGEVFVRGFLKNYAKFLRLSEAEAMKRYAELQPSKAAPAASAAPAAAPAMAAKTAETAPGTQQTASSFPVEPFIWGAGIVIILVVFLFTAFPKQKTPEPKKDVPQQHTAHISTAITPTVTAPVKLYLEVIAQENTWLLIRTDNSPQKKSILKKGESLIWSAEERFLLSYGSVGSLKLLLNGVEMTVNEPAKTVVRDLEVTAKGVVDRKIPPKPAEKPGAKPAAKPAENNRSTAPTPAAPQPKRQ